MRARMIRQRELFDDEQTVARPGLQPEVLEEVRQLLTQWLHDLSEAMVQEERHEHDRR